MKASGGGGAASAFAWHQQQQRAAITGGRAWPRAHAGGGAGVSGSSSTVANSGSITGGTGGSGAIDGGGGVGISGAGLTITNTPHGPIAGGDGGPGGNGGAGISVSSTTVINSGSIAGGSGSTPANAIIFTGGTNVLELRAGSTITGNVVAFSAADTLRLGGGANASLDVGLIGSAARFRNFGQFEKSGTSTWTLTGTPGQATPWTITQGTLAVGGASSLGAGSTLTFNGGTLQAAAALSLNNAIVLNGTGTLDTNGNDITLAGNITGGGGVTKQGAGTLTLSGASTYAGATAINDGTLKAGAVNAFSPSSAHTVAAGHTLDLNNFSQAVGSLAGAGSVTLGSGTLTAGGNNTDTSFSGVISGTGGLTKAGAGTMTLAGNNTYGGTTAVNAGTLAFTGDTGSLGGPMSVSSGANVTFGQAVNSSYAGVISGDGSVTKSGAGTMTLSGTNSYTGGTTVSGGLLQGTTTSLQGNILNNASVTFNQATNGTYAGSMSGTGGLTIQGGGAVTLTGTNSYSGGTSVLGGVLIGNSTSLQGNILNNAAVTFNQTGTGTYGGVMSGTGGMTLQGGGVLNLTANNTYTGATTVNASTLVVNGSLASTVTLNSGSMLGGSGTIGGLVSNGATLAPGNSIGTLNVSGNFSQTGGTYVVEANAQGQADRVNATGTATINGGTVQVVAAPGSYGTSTTYTILNAAGGRTGTYSSVSSSFAFLTPSLSYDPNNVFLTLALQGNAFSGFGGNTVNQRAVGSALDRSFANATGDFATVIGALAGLNTAQGPWALNQISGQPYADFGTFNVANNALFMNALGQQMALARGGQGSGQRQALAEACDVAACDGTSPFSVWGSVLGGLGSVQGDGNSSAFTYNVGGGAAGIDYRLSPSFLVGLGAGYTNGTQWVDSFQGKGWSNSVSVAAYASFTQWGLYLDALAGYAYSNNQLQRQISVPGLQPRTANGSTGANQFLAQAELGYQVPVYAPAQATVTPFARFQTSSINQAAFNEWGATSLSLNVQQQTTTSVRTVLGAELAGAIGLGDTRTLDLGLRLGWLHEYANTARPITAAFAGASSANFTVYGATPQRDAAVIGFQASTTVAAATQLYLRYDGDIGSGTDNHALNVGVRLRW